MQEQVRKDAARRDGLQGQSIHVEVLLEREIDLLAVAGQLGRVEHDHVEAIAGRQHVAQPGEEVGLHERNPHLVQVGVLLRQGDGLLVEIDADHVRGLAERLGVDREAARVAAQIEHLLAVAERGQGLAIVALIDEEAGLVLAARRDAEAHAVLGDRERRRRLRRPAVERLLLADVLLGEPVEARLRKVRQQRRLDRLALPVHAGGEELQHQQGAEAIDDQAAQSVGLGVDEAISVGDGVELQQIAAQARRPGRSCARTRRHRWPRSASAVRMRKAMREWPL